LDDARTEYVSATTAYLRFLQGREALKSKLREKRVVSDDEVDFYRVQVALCRHVLAHLQDDSAEARKQLRVALDVRKEQCARLKRLRPRGGGSEAETNVAERQLSSARYRLAREEGNMEEAVQQLQRIEEIAGRELERERRLLGRSAAALAEVEDTTYRLVKARYLLARLKEREDECKKQLRDLADLTGSALARLQKLDKKGASSEEEINWARLRDCLAQQRRAGAEGDTQRVRELQEHLASLTAQMFRNALRSSHATEEESEYLKWESALQRFRLVQAQYGKVADYESIWELDGWTHIPH
jgi:hypothetical protein